MLTDTPGIHHVTDPDRTSVELVAGDAG